MNDAIAALFGSEPRAIVLYDALEKAIMAMPSVTRTILKTQVSFGTRRGFAWVWLPIMRVKGRPDVYIVLSFGLGRRLDNPRIEQAVEPYPNRWTHHVIIGDESEIDDELLGWLVQAHEFASR